jgi:hypothetical protein
MPLQSTTLVCLPAAGGLVGAKAVVGLDLRDDGCWNIFFGPALLAVLDERERLLQRAEGRTEVRR